MIARHADEQPGRTSLRPTDGRASFMATLSLFLLLLAFFVLLSTLSRFEATRTEAVLGSLDATFRAADESGVTRRLDSLAGAIVGAERLEGVVTDILRTGIALGVYEVVRVGSELTAIVSVSEMFEESSADPRPGILDLADALADALAKQPAGLRYEVDVFMHPGEGAEALAVGRANTLAQAFFDGGVEDGGLAVGLGSGDPQKIQLVFRVLAVDDSGVSYSVDERPGAAR